MTKLATTRMSSKGQVVIPEDIRKRLKLEAGSQFIVVAGKDAVILKTISPPSMDEFEQTYCERCVERYVRSYPRSHLSVVIERGRAQNS